jgi:predicted RNA-binding protein with RPS1 domain
VAQRYEVGKEISGVITNLTDFGVFVELEEGIEGLVHVSEISKENIKSPKDHYQVGDTITAKVMNINSDERRIGLSIKRLEDDDDDRYLEEFAKNMKPATSSFGEILRSNIQDHRLDGIAFFVYLRRVLDALGPGNVGNVHQTVNIIINADEQAEFRNIFNFSFNDGAHRIFLGDHFPGIFLGLLDA